MRCNYRPVRLTSKLLRLQTSPGRRAIALSHETQAKLNSLNRLLRAWVVTGYRFASASPHQKNDVIASLSIKTKKK
jgi:hypothetical protein